MKITYFVEVVSSWCHWAEPTWARLRAELEGRAEFEWKIALMDPSGLPVSRAQCEWFYRRSGTIMRSPYMLDAGWFEPGLPEYLAPNLVPEAAKAFGVTDDRARLAVADAALRRGRRVGLWEESAAVVAAACGLDATRLLEHARSPEVEARCRRSTAEFHALGARQRPTFVIESAIGDRAVFSGLVAHAPLAATVEAMSRDADGYAAHRAHFGEPPAA